MIAVENMGWFKRSQMPINSLPTADMLLLERFLQLEQTRLEKRADLDSKREEIELRKMELELQHLEARTKAQIELDAAKQELREKRREFGKRGMQKLRAIRRGGQPGTCPLCDDPNRRDVTIPMIEAHRTHEAIARPAEQMSLAHVGWNGPSGPADPSGGGLPN